MGLGASVRGRFEVLLGFFCEFILPAYASGFLNSTIYVAALECPNVPKSASQLLLQASSGMVYVLTRLSHPQHVWVHNLMQLLQAVFGFSLLCWE